MDAEQPTAEMAVIADADDLPPTVIDERHRGTLRVLERERALLVEAARARLRAAGMLDEDLDAALIRASVRAGIAEVER